MLPIVIYWRLTVRMRPFSVPSRKAKVESIRRHLWIRAPAISDPKAYPCLCSERLYPRGHSPRTREDGVEQATLVRRGTDDPPLSDDELKLLAQIASGVTADVAARKLELSARTLRRRLRSICDRLEVNTPIEAVVWAARRHLI